MFEEPDSSMVKLAETVDPASICNSSRVVPKDQDELKAVRQQRIRWTRCDESCWLWVTMRPEGVAHRCRRGSVQASTDGCTWWYGFRCSGSQQLSGHVEKVELAVPVIPVGGNGSKILSAPQSSRRRSGARKTGELVKLLREQSGVLRWEVYCYCWGRCYGRCQSRCCVMYQRLVGAEQWLPRSIR